MNKKKSLKNKLPYHKAAPATISDMLDEALAAQQNADIVRLTCLLHEAGGLFSLACMTKVPRKHKGAFVKEMYGLFKKAWELGGEEFEGEFGTPEGFRRCLNADL